MRIPQKVMSIMASKKNFFSSQADVDAIADKLLEAHIAAMFDKYGPAGLQGAQVASFIDGLTDVVQFWNNKARGRAVLLAFEPQIPSLS